MIKPKHRRKSLAERSGLVGDIFHGLLGELGIEVQDKHTWTSSEKNLVIVVLYDALRCLREGDRIRHPQRTETLKWLMSADRSWPFSFESACDILDLNVAAVRAVYLKVEVNAEKGTTPTLRQIPRSSLRPTLRWSRQRERELKRRRARAMA